jgi:hypothetical protein
MGPLAAELGILREMSDEVGATTPNKELRV